MTPAAKPQQGVFVLRKTGGKLKAVFVPVTTGITGATDIEITSGLQAGDEDRHRNLSRPARRSKTGHPVKIDTTPVVVKDTDSSSSYAVLPSLPNRGANPGNRQPWRSA